MPGRLAGFAMLARRLDSFAQTREIIVIGMARRFVEVLDELMHARSLLGLCLLYTSRPPGTTTRTTRDAAR